ncbi:MAG: outer membrane beta-barrel protein [Muribaculaceae bacterium]|nr:outer membrane beta-barrel protein [Muribaculaceae bacterium]
MKKIIYTAFLVLLSVFSSNAQDFRGCKGFIDFYGGMGVGNEKESYSAGYSTISEIGPRMSVGLNVTGGYQITDYLFAGIGFGGYTVLDRYKEEYNGDKGSDYYFPAIMLPVFVDCRWTLNINRKITPFVDLKLGYQFRCSLEEGKITYNYQKEDLFLNQEAGFYCQPTVGVRFGKASGFNLGITFNPTIRQSLYYGRNYKNLTLLKKLSQGTVMLSLGADF